MTLLGSVASAWLALLLMAAAAALALTARAAGRPLVGLGWHIAFGILAPLLALFHAMAAMGGLRLMTRLELSLALGALAVAWLQAWIGLCLHDARGPARRALRPFHFSLMLVLAGAAGAHAWLNRT